MKSWHMAHSEERVEFAVRGISVAGPLRNPVRLLFRAWEKCSGLVDLIYGVLCLAMLGLKCFTPKWVLSHQVKARLVGKKEM